MQQISLDELLMMSNDARSVIWRDAKQYGREPKIYLHWTAGWYNSKFDDYHINIDGDGRMYVSVNDLSTVLNHTWKRNTGAVGLAVCCCADATTNGLGTAPPTSAQIETMSQAIAKVADGLWLTIDIGHVMTHGEAADNIDGLWVHEPYGCQHGCERWDLQFLGTSESPKYTADYNSIATGGNVLRGKANWYRNKWRQG